MRFILDNQRTWLIVGGIGLVFLFCCMCIFVAVLGYSLFSVNSIVQVYSTAVVVQVSSPSPTPIQGLDAAPAVPTLDPSVELIPSPTAKPLPTGSSLSEPTSSETLNTLENALVPINDPLELAERLEGKQNIPATLSPPPAPFQVGAQRDFWVTNVDTNENFQVGATLQYVTPHLYFWIEDGVDFDRGELRDLAETFEKDIYPTNRAFFGSEWSPGVDGDPHIYILYASNLGFNLAGYFSSADEYHPQAREYSNAVELFLLNADNIGLDERFTYGVLAHEFQHMIHWYQDRNESSWLNEGFSELAAFLNDYYDSGFDTLYVSDPDLQLNDWPNDPNATTPHYGAGFLFVTYFLDRFGDTATQSLVAHPENGMTSVDQVLEELNIRDSLTGEPVRADDVFLDWVIATYLQDSAVFDGRFVYRNYPQAPQPGETETIQNCPTGKENRTVNQYGVDYIRLTCEGNFQLNFQGSASVGVVPENPYSGEYMFWSNKGDESDMTLTRTFDFTEQSGPITLSYYTWYDLEQDYDYLYLVASTDGGSTWQILTTPSGTAEDPSGNSYGWGYNGLSGGGRSAEWIREQIDLSAFSGQQVELRFEYVTDAAVNGEGLLLDDIAIPEIGYFTDFEQDDGGWQAAGFVRIRNELPQTYRLALIKTGDETSVEFFELDENNSANLPVQIGGAVDEVILVVTGTTRFTRQNASYEFSISP